MLFSSSNEPLTTLCGGKSTGGLGETSATVDSIAVTSLLSPGHIGSPRIRRVYSSSFILRIFPVNGTVLVYFHRGSERNFHTILFSHSGGNIGRSWLDRWLKGLGSFSISVRTNDRGVSWTNFVTLI